MSAAAASKMRENVRISITFNNLATVHKTLHHRYDRSGRAPRTFVDLPRNTAIRLSAAFRNMGINALYDRVHLVTLFQIQHLPERSCKEHKRNQR